MVDEAINWYYSILENKEVWIGDRVTTMLAKMRVI